jgi:REP element-mobilizing transposase RayT
MTNHLYLIVDSTKTPLSDVLRDFKKYTATRVVKAIEANSRESRRNWLFWLFKKDDGIWFWKDGYHGEEIFSRDFLRQN